MTTTLRKPMVTMAGLLLVCVVAHAQSPDPETPVAVVRQLQEALLESMTAGERLDFEQRAERLRPIIERGHHFDAIARFMLGRHARALDDQQFTDIVEALRQLSVAEYATRFNRYNGEKLEILESSELGADRVMVLTRLTKADGDPVHLEYVLQKHDDQWGVVNIVADGVSDLALKRAEYSTVLRNEGYTALLDRLREQIAETRPK